MIQPSIYEGFGATPLESLYLGTVPIISNISVFKEVYNNLPVVFFQSEDSADLSKKILNSNWCLNFDFEETNMKFSYSNVWNTLSELLRKGVA